MSYKILVQFLNKSSWVEKNISRSSRLIQRYEDTEINKKENGILIFDPNLIDGIG